MEASSTTALPPIFVRSNFSFKLLGQEYSFTNQGVSLFGVSGLRWHNFAPIEHVGEQLTISVDVLTRNRFQFTAPAMITAEVTTDATYLGLKFYLQDQDREKLHQAIKAEGYYPTNYMRKYPRIPAWRNIARMPLRTIVTTRDGELIVFDIANLSPGGILLHTENPNAAVYTPGANIHGQVEPRGGTFLPFQFDGMVCRLLLDQHPQSKNTNRFLGVRFLRLDPNQKENFLGILRAVLDDIVDDNIATE
jgi:hypothetical protein